MKEIHNNSISLLSYFSEFIYCCYKYIYIYIYIYINLFYLEVNNSRIRAHATIS